QEHLLFCFIFPPPFYFCFTSLLLPPALPCPALQHNLLCFGFRGCAWSWFCFSCVFSFSTFAETLSSTYDGNKESRSKDRVQDQDGVVLRSVVEDLRAWRVSSTVINEPETGTSSTELK
ncbi:unnamed protein product, partial [Discosporangium mesarthrocarpum]